MGQPTPPLTVDDFKAQFTRDFLYGSGLDKVRDADITSGLALASTVFNPDLFDTTEVHGTSEAKLAYLYASAHFLVLSLRSAGGLAPQNKGRGARAQGEGPIGNASVAGVNAGYVWPSRVVDNAMLFQFTKTPYGQTFLQMLMPKLVGGMAVGAGNREP